MSFIDENKTAKVHAAGWFLDHEECVRKTREVTQDMAVTEDNGTKYVPMGTIYPSNDSNAEGIVYEDVDVTTGNMPASVVLSGVVIESRLAVTGLEFGAATVTSADDPATKGWYEKDGDNYDASIDTVAVKGKTYYTRSGSSPDYTYTEVSAVEYGDNPKELGLYERSGSSPNYVYTKSTDTQADGAKTYYEVTGVETISDAAKSALAGKGFVFVDEPTVVRPY